MNNLFLTGRSGVGKSTILKRVLNDIDLAIGGYMTDRIFEGPYRRYIARSLKDPNEGYTIVRSDSRDKSKVCFPEAFEKGLVPILDKSLKDDDLIVLDELGSAEDDIDIFTYKVFELLDSPKLVLGVIKDEDCKFLNAIRSRKDVIVIKITEENRDYIWEEVLKMLNSSIKKSKF